MPVQYRRASAGRRIYVREMEVTGSGPSELECLAGLIRVKNEADRAIAQLIARPCTPGNIGEFVAAKVFAIRLSTTGVQPGYDGEFEEGPLAGKTVNVKAYSRQEYVLDISPHPCDYYLVLTGPPGQAQVLPWVIHSVFLFDQKELLGKLRSGGVKIGVATSVAEGVLGSRTDLPASQCGAT